MYLKLKTVLLALLTCSLLACAHSYKVSSENIAELAAFPPHIEVNCRIYNKLGEQLRTYPGSFCIYEDSGELIMADKNKVTRYDKKLKPLWEKTFNYIHHQFRKSAVTGNILFIDSELEKKEQQNFRHDVLKIIDENGRTLKSVNLKNVLIQIEKRGHKINSAVEADWFKNVAGPDTSYYENTHINSFYELYETVNGKTELFGYVANCFHQDMVIILDKDLKQVVRVIDTGVRALHDVQPFNQKLVFYQNRDSKLHEEFSAKIVAYSFASNSFETIYKPANKKFTALACSSVQMLDTTYMFLFHSACVFFPNKTLTYNVLEFVNLKNKKSFYIEMRPEVRANTAYMLDATEFLKNSISL
jgi:hypothetical protein